MPEGAKISPENVIDIRRLPNGGTVWLEIGDILAGLRHIIHEHTVEFAQKGIAHDQIAGAVFMALESGKIIGYQGKGTNRPIYEFSFNGQALRLAITVSNNGFIVGVNSYSMK